MSGAGLSFGNLAWLAPVGGVWLAAVAASIVGHWRNRSGRWALGLALRLAGISILALALLEPAWSTPRARPGANQFALLVDDSRSLQLPDHDGQPRAAALQSLLAGNSGWQRALAEVYQLRRYRFDARLERVPDFTGLRFDGRASHLASALGTLAERFKSAPLAGVLLFTDGNATDLEQLQRGWAGLQGLPPVYVVALGAATRQSDLAVAQVSASETLFEDAPVNIEARIEAIGARGRPVLVQLRDDRDQLVETRTLTPSSDHDTQAVSFRVKPPVPPAAGPAKAASSGAPAPTHYRVTVAAGPGQSLREATAANNARSVLVPRPRGPARLLYVGGRPNWEYKFLRRALERDRLLELVALLRVAPREPKFAFLTRKGEAINPLFRGFGASADDAERFDEAVLQRMGTRDAEELRAGFPKSAEELFEYRALILDDVEAGFFTAAQQTLVERFVTERGGGFLMLGGLASFRRGGYDRTPIGDLLPVYLDRSAPAGALTPARFTLSREGWLEAWMRLRDNEAGERARLDAMPAFKVASATRGLKPGASVLATLSAGKNELPALVLQRAGEGRSGALTIGDLWRWGMRRSGNEADDLGKFWRQSLRALVSDVPGRVTVALVPHPGEAGALAVKARVRGRDFRPVDSSEVTVEIDAVAPDGTRTRLQTEPASAEPGGWGAQFRPQTPGIHRVQVRASARDGRPLGEAEAGRALDLDADEHRSIRPNLALLEDLARQTGGAVIEPAALDNLLQRLRDRPAPVSDLHLRPLWHSWAVLLLALACLAAEWTLRRRRGLP